MAPRASRNGWKGLTGGKRQLARGDADTRGNQFARGNLGILDDLFGDAPGGPMVLGFKGPRRHQAGPAADRCPHRKTGESTGR